MGSAFHCAEVSFQGLEELISLFFVRVMPCPFNIISHGARDALGELA